MRFVDEHVAQPGEGRRIGHDAGEADLPPIEEHPEAE
jgi:hypothetical protein